MLGSSSECRRVNKGHTNLRVVEDKAGGCINGDSPRVRRRVWLLTGMELQGIELGGSMHVLVAITMTVDV